MPLTKKTGKLNMLRKKTANDWSILSDHMPFMVLDENMEMTFISWNILTQMKFDAEMKYFNNGFICYDETDEQYTNRLLHIVAQINDAAKSTKPGFICLQECPATCTVQSMFIDALKQGDELQHYGTSFLHSYTDGIYLTTLYDVRSYSYDMDLSQKMNKVRLNEGLKGRVLAEVYCAKATNEKILVVNVHANFTKEIKEDVKALYHHAAQLGLKQVVLLGDYNRDLVLESDNYSKHDIAVSLNGNRQFEESLYVNAVVGASFCTRYNKETEQKSQGIETRDGVMSTFKVSVHCMSEYNIPNVALSFTKNISPRLSSVPNGFLEKFELQIDARATLTAS